MKVLLIMGWLISAGGLAQTPISEIQQQRQAQLQTAKQITQWEKEIEAWPETLSRIEVDASRLQDQLINGGSGDAWSQHWNRIWQESTEALSRLDETQSRLRAYLASAAIDKPSLTILQSLIGRVERLGLDHRRAMEPKRLLASSAAALNAARWLTGTLMMERLMNILEQQAVALSADYLAERAGFLAQGLERQRGLCQRLLPELKRLPMAPKDAQHFAGRWSQLCEKDLESYTTEIDEKSFVNTMRRHMVKKFFTQHPEGKTPALLFVKNLPAALAQDGKVYTSFCMESVFDSYARAPGSFLKEDQAILDSKQTPERMLQELCDLRRPLVDARNPLGSWMETTLLLGEASFDLGTGQNVDCPAVRSDFQKYIRAYEDSISILERMMKVFDDYLAGRLDDAAFHSLYDPLEESYQELEQAQEDLFPAAYFTRDQSFHLRWSTVKPQGADAKFVPWIVDFGPSSWNGAWQVDLAQQDWFLRGPIVDKVQGLQFDLKASVQDICIDQRSVWIFGFWGDNACSSGRCLFLKPALSLRVGAL